MEDLFGHRQRPIMPKTKALEDYIYQGQPIDKKDMNFSLEDYDPILAEKEYLKSNNAVIVLGTGIPKIEPYTYESISGSYRRLRKTGLDDIQVLIDLDAETFNKIACRIPSEYVAISPASFLMLNKCIEMVAVLSDGFMADTLEAVSEVCSTEFDIDRANQRFLEISEKLGSICDNVLVENQNRVNECYQIGSSPEGQLAMGQSDFEYSMNLLATALQRSHQLDTDILNITCFTQNIIANCMRIERDYNQFTPLGRPTLGKLSRFARDVEKVPQVLDLLLHVMVETCGFANTMIGLKNRQA